MNAVTCPGCERSLRTKEEMAGKKVRCSGCGEILRIPAGQELLLHAAGGVSSSPGATAATLPPAPQPTGAFGSQPATLASGRLATEETRADPGAEGNPAGEWDSFLSPPLDPRERGGLGPYRVLRVLGAGGMGVVFLAEDSQLHRPVALKAMLPTLAGNSVHRQRFLREARMAAAIEHEHVVTIHQVGEDRGVPFLAMPLLKGESLEDRLQRVGKLPLTEVLRIGREIAEGLQAAHELGLIHRDIKPANIWLEGARARVKILDFGLARALADTGLTQQGTILGTPAYMAPEQGRGDPVDERSDLFSLGCVLYRACTGFVPFPGSDLVAQLMAVATHEPPPLSSTSAHLGLLTQWEQGHAAADGGRTRRVFQKPPGVRGLQKPIPPTANVVPP